MEIISRNDNRGIGEALSACQIAVKFLDSLLENPMEIKTDGGAVLLARQINIHLRELPAQEAESYRERLRKIYDF